MPARAWTTGSPSIWLVIASKRCEKRLTITITNLILINVVVCHGIQQSLCLGLQRSYGGRVCVWIGLQPGDELPLQVIAADKQWTDDEMWKLLCPSQISIFSSVAMVTARRTFGIGRPQSCCRSGRRMTMSAFRQSPLPLCTHSELQDTPIHLPVTFYIIQTDPHLQVLWHPHEASKVATAGWDGVVKFWDWDFPNLFYGKSLCYKRGNLI